MGVGGGPDQRHLSSCPFMGLRMVGGRAQSCSGRDMGVTRFPSSYSFALLSLTSSPPLLLLQARVAHKQGLCSPVVQGGSQARSQHSSPNAGLAEEAVAKEPGAGRSEGRMHCLGRWDVARTLSSRCPGALERAATALSAPRVGCVT